MHPEHEGRSLDSLVAERESRKAQGLPHSKLNDSIMELSPTPWLKGEMCTRMNQGKAVRKIARELGRRHDA